MSLIEDRRATEAYVHAKELLHAIGKVVSSALPDDTCHIILVFNEHGSAYVSDVASEAILIAELKKVIADLERTAGREEPPQ